MRNKSEINIPWIQKQIEKLDGCAAVNLSEPSKGDLERVFLAYQDTRDELERLERELAEAKEVIQFYAHPLHWKDELNNPDWDSAVIQDDDLSVPEGLCDKRGGKRARAFLGKHTPKN